MQKPNTLEYCIRPPSFASQSINQEMQLGTNVEGRAKGVELISGKVIILNDS